MSQPATNGLQVWSKIRRAISFTEGVIRYARTARIGATTFLDYWWQLRNLKEDTEPYEVALLKCHTRAADRILKGALKNGGIYIKVGQALATLNHIMPKEFTDKLSRLQDQAPKRKYREIELLFLEDFGRKPLDVFKEFDPVPIAAASLAQVHSATTHDDQRVAVKVQYIDLRERFHGDMETIRVIARVFDWLYPQLDRVRIFDQIRQNLNDELDFEKEAKNSQKCHQQLRSLGYVYVPEVFWAQTSKRVLTMEFIDGIKPTDVAELDRHNFNRREVAHKVVQTFNHQIFHTGFIHADPHPGNIFIRRDINSNTQVVLLDHGLYTEVADDTRVAFAKFWKQLILKDEAGIRDSCHELGIKQYQLFSMMMTGKALKNHLTQSRNTFTDVTKNDVEEIRKFISANQNKIDELTKSLPPATYLMFRNINIVRSINRDLGTPVNRFELMSRSAAAACATHSNGTLQLLWHTAVFDFKLRWFVFRMWLMGVYMKVLVALELVPHELGEQLKQMQA